MLSLCPPTLRRMTLTNFRLCGILLAALNAALPAAAQQPRTPVETTRTDAHGVIWTYEESADPMDDAWQVLAFGELARGPDRGAAIGFLCAEGWGIKMRLDVPRWVVGDGNRRTLQARIDGAPAFPIEVVGEPSAASFVYVSYREGGAALVSALVGSARDRIAVQGPDGLVTIFPMAGERPETTRAWERCRELLRRPPPASGPAP